MKRLYILWIVALLMAPIDAVADDTYADKIDFEDALNEVYAAAERGDWTTAASLSIDIIESDPANAVNPLILANYGYCLLQVGEVTTAIDVLSRAHELAPLSVKILTNRANAYVAAKRLEDAISDYSEIIAIDPEDAGSYYNLHQLNSILGEHEKALEYANEMVKRFPSASSYAIRALTFMLLNRQPEAAEDLALGMELDPENPLLYLHRAALHLMRYQKDDMRADVEHAIELGMTPEYVKSFFDMWQSARP